MSQQQHNSHPPSMRSPLQPEQENGAGKGKTPLPSPMRPQGNNPGEWKAYWQTQQQPWRTEPEISSERQAELKKCRDTPADDANSIYPFKGMVLDRADIEWLLATPENGRDSVLLTYSLQETRKGFDLRGADLSHAQLQRVSLSGAQLEGARLLGVQLEGADLSYAQLQRTYLVEIQLQEADLSYAQLEGADLSEAQLEGANLLEAQLEGASLSCAHLKGASLFEAQLERTDLFDAHLEGVDLRRARLQGADLRGAQLQGADLRGAQLQGADLRGAQLQEARLDGIQLSGMDRVGPFLADVQWSSTNLATVEWSQIMQLGEEYRARQKKIYRSTRYADARLQEYQIAVRANRQLAVALQGQGINEDAARFAYRANVLQRKVLWYQTRMKPEREEMQKRRKWYKRVESGISE